MDMWATILIWGVYVLLVYVLFYTPVIYVMSIVWAIIAGLMIVLAPLYVIWRTRQQRRKRKVIFADENRLPLNNISVSLIFRPTYIKRSSKLTKYTKQTRFQDQSEIKG